MEKVLMVGTGDVGAHLLEFMARQDHAYEVIVGDIDEEKARLLCNNAVIGAAHHGKNPIFRPVKVDLFDIEGTTELIQKEKPSAVINLTVMHTWHLIRQLPEDVYAKISSAALGAWLPCQLTLPMKLAQALKASGVKAHYINTSLSCLTNPVLGKIGLAPTIGIGNIDMIQPGVRTYVAQQAGIARSRVETLQVCHHQHWVYPREAGYLPDAPYLMKIMIDKKDVTSDWDTDKIMYEAVKLYPEGLPFTSVSASSTLKNLNALLFDANLMTHSPGPKGLPGGYPVKLNAEGAEVYLPSEWTLEQAIKVNEKAGQLDAIEEIKDDGTVVFADYTYDIMKDSLGFDCKSFIPADSEKLAREQMERFRELIEKYS
ncbi:MAG: hypothetical protein BA862_10490 [Desulfobulbaceae bacterium S3730MH12]|nr:MAG: hypothetical protein BA862_10490 [Desulfobulbaceae bacterium S3730MH12]